MTTIKTDLIKFKIDFCKEKVPRRPVLVWRKVGPRVK
jgi:hypothetical protein